MSSYREKSRRIALCGILAALALVFLCLGGILPFAAGVCMAIQGEGAVLRDAFGVVALVAMTPLITIQLLGFKAIVSNKLRERRAMKRILDADDQQIINFM